MTFQQVVPISQNARSRTSKLEQILKRVKEGIHQAFSNNLAIDLGTTNTILYLPEQGVVVNEPSIIAFDRETDKIITVGQETKLALGRQASTIRIVRPLKEGVIADFDAAKLMLSYFIKTALVHRKLCNPRMLICVPGEISEVERRAFEDIAGRTGAVNVDIIEGAITSAIGAGFDIQSGRVFMMVDIGGGTTDIAVLGYGGPVHLSTLRVGGSKMDEAIIQYMRHSHCLEIGELTAEAIKLEIGSYGSENNGVPIEVRGRNLKTGLPAVVTVASEDLRGAVEPVVQEIIQAVRNALEDLSPEVSAALLDSGIVLGGGASRFAGLAERMTLETGIETRQAASDVQSLAVLGAGKLFHDGSYTSIREMMVQRRGEKPHDRGRSRENPVSQIA